jgi:hypothetical protein
MGFDNLQIATRLLESLTRNKMAASEDPVEVAQAIGVGIRVAHLLAYERIKSLRGEFPASIHAMMDLPEERIDSERDAFTEPLDYIDFVDMLDILSDAQLDCISPHLHRGWQDKAQSCRNARRVAKGAVGFSVGFRFRGGLLAAAAIYNRIFGVPAPVRVSLDETRTAFSSILQLTEALVPPAQKDRFEPLIEALQE